MRRITKKFLLFLFGVVFTCFYCEYLIYYVVIAQCSWPHVQQSQNDTLKAFILADTHMLGPRQGHWLDKLRREWQMHQAYQTILTIHQPDAVFILGDLFDEGEWSDDEEFDDYVKRFYKLFAVPNYMKMHVVAGNHDIGFHYYIRENIAKKFTKMLNASASVQFVTIKNNHFVLLNSMAMQGDSCQLCTEAIRRIERISEKLKCSQSTTNTQECDNVKKIKYSAPILMQHFPLHRLSDAVCTEPDAPPLQERNHRFRPQIDALSQGATEYLVAKISPRAAFGGHTHHGCLLDHTFNVTHEVKFKEYSVPSFSWRNRVDPKYMLVTFTPTEYAVNKCGLPKEATIVVTGVLLLLFFAIYTIKMRIIGRN